MCVVRLLRKRLENYNLPITAFLCIESALNAAVKPFKNAIEVVSNGFCTKLVNF